MLTREQILKVDDIQIEKVEVPVWHDHVFVKGLTGEERDAFEISIMRFEPGEKSGEKPKTIPILENMRAKLCVMTICNEKGERLFKDQDVPALGRKSADALDTCYTVAQRLSGLTESDIDKLAKNLKSAQ